MRLVEERVPVSASRMPDTTEKNAGKRYTSPPRADMMSFHDELSNKRAREPGSVVSAHRACPWVKRLRGLEEIATRLQSLLRRIYRLEVPVLVPPTRLSEECGAISIPT